MVLRVTYCLELHQAIKFYLERKFSSTKVILGSIMSKHLIMSLYIVIEIPLKCMAIIHSIALFQIASDTKDLNVVIGC